MSSNDPDSQFFVDHPDRKAHIRAPRMVLHTDARSHVTRYVAECEMEFRSLGAHDKDRRRIILTRSDHRGMPIKDNKVLKIPMLAYSDETIEDRDDVLLPIIFELMANQVEHDR